MKIVYLLMVLLGFSTASQARLSKSGPALNKEVCQTMQGILQHYSEQQVFQGSVVLSHQGEPVCDLNTGIANREKQIPVKSGDLFPIASLSKPIMATLLVKMHEQGKLDLDAPLSDYLPDFPAPWAKDVTLHHLLANRSGLPGHFALPGWQSGRFKQPMPKGDV